MRIIKCVHMARVARSKASDVPNCHLEGNGKSSENIAPQRAKLGFIQESLGSLGITICYEAWGLGPPGGWAAEGGPCQGPGLGLMGWSKPLRELVALDSLLTPPAWPPRLEAWGWGVASCFTTKGNPPCRGWTDYWTCTELHGSVLFSLFGYKGPRPLKHPSEKGT